MLLSAMQGVLGLARESWNTWLVLWRASATIFGVACCGATRSGGLVGQLFPLVFVLTGLYLMLERPGRPPVFQPRAGGSTSPQQQTGGTCDYRATNRPAVRGAG